MVEEKEAIIEITGKGALTIPKSMRKQIGINGNRYYIRIHVEGNEIILKKMSFPD